LKLAIRPWKLSPWSQIFSALAVGILLLLVGFLFWVQEGLRPVLMRLRYEQVITAFIDPSVEAQDESQIIDSIRTTLGSQAVSEFNLVNTQQSLEKIKSRYPELGRELEDLGAEKSQVVPRYVSISGFFSDTTLDVIRKTQGIESADSSKDRFKNILSAFSALRFVSRLLVIGLCVALLTGLIHLSRTNALVHEDVVSLLRLWGASDPFVRFPLLISAVLVGIIGGMVAAISWSTVGVRLSNHIRVLSPLLNEMPPLSGYFPVVLVWMGALLGMLAGILALIFGPSKASSRRP